MSISVLTPAELARALAVPDLTDPAEGPHALQRLVDAAVDALARAWRSNPVVHRGTRVVPVADNYDALGYDPAAVARDSRYSRYVDDATMLRSHTSALVPGALRAYVRDACDDEVLLACPGVVYRRDSIDRMHTGTPHQLDLWRVTRRAPVGPADLKEMVEIVVRTLLPGAEWRCSSRVHPYTTDGLQIDVDNGGEWVEIGECGVAAPAVLRGGGASEAWSGLAMGLGLDRILMLRKGIADIRLLRSSDARVLAQMRDLSLYRPVSNHPAIVRDLSLAVASDLDAELLGDRVRAVLGDRAALIEAVEVVSSTPAAALAPAARGRLGIRSTQQNVLVRLVLRAVDRTLTRDEANELRDAVFDALHEGSAS